jgi:hypothetical protein
MVVRENYEKVKTHIRENKRTYLAVGGTVVVTVLITKRPVVTQVAKNTALVVWKPTNTNIAITNVTRRGHPGNIVRCIETGEVFASQNRAADAMRLSRSVLSQHLNGLQPAVSGLTFEKLGEAVA